MTQYGPTRRSAVCREVQRLEINFKEPLGTFKAGDMLSGSVQMTIVREFKTKGVQLLLHGVAIAQWDEQRAYTKGSAGILSHRNAEVYLNETVILSSSNCNTLKPIMNCCMTQVTLWYLATITGRSAFVCRCIFPLPFGDQRWGRVQYVAKVSVERPWKAAVECGRNFTVLGLLDLNTEPDAKNPVENIQETLLGPGCCQSGPVSGHVMIEKSGFTVGQNIPFNVKIENYSRKRLNIRMVFTQNASFRADKQVRRSKTVLKVVSRPTEIKPGETVTWTDEIKDVPPVPPSRLGGGCKMIELKYLMTMIAVPSGLGKDFEVPVEIIIGTVPLRRQESTATLGYQQLLAVKTSMTRQSSNSSSKEVFRRESRSSRDGT